MSGFYSESLADSEPIRELYVESTDRAVKLLQEWARTKREMLVTPKSMAENREEYRKEYAHLLGIDVCREVFGSGIPQVEISFIGKDCLSTIERLKIKIADGVYFTGILLTPHNREEKAPLVVMSHGGGGSPELCCDMIGKNNYSGVVRKLLEKGVIVFAHQLLLWNLSPVLCESAIPQYGVKYNREKTNHEMKHCGASIAGFEIYCISRTLDYLLKKENVDPDRCGMLGLSYGGFYTLYTMAYDKRIKVGLSSAFFNDRMKYDWNDVVWQGSAARFLDCEVAGLCAPRKLIVDVGMTDTVFDYRSGEAQRERISAFYEASNAKDNLVFNVWEGGHKFSLDSLGRFVEGI